MDYNNNVFTFRLCKEVHGSLPALRSSESFDPKKRDVSRFCWRTYRVTWVDAVTRDDVQQRHVTRDRLSHV